MSARRASRRRMPTGIPAAGVNGRSEGTIRAGSTPRPQIGAKIHSRRAFGRPEGPFSSPVTARTAIRQATTAAPGRFQGREASMHDPRPSAGLSADLQAACARSSGDPVRDGPVRHSAPASSRNRCRVARRGVWGFSPRPCSSVPGKRRDRASRPPRRRRSAAGRPAARRAAVSRARRRAGGNPQARRPGRS